jgi:CDP-paratose 2-epimerase
MPAINWEGWRMADQRYYVSDTSAFEQLTGWRATVPVRSGIADLYEWLSDAGGGRMPLLAAAANR